VPGPLPRPLSIALATIRGLLGALILAGVALNFANVIGRYVFLRPIIWAEEILVFIMIWCVMLGATLVTWENQHLRMDAVHQLAPPRVRRWLDVVSTAVFLAVGVFLLVQSARVVAVVAGTGQRSVVAEIPMIVPYGAIPVSFGLIVAVLAWRFRAFTLAGTGDVPDDAREGG
jgi:TRAP-type C4-dicarboxylate transport system permease small subunit